MKKNVLRALYLIVSASLFIPLLPVSAATKPAFDYQFVTQSPYPSTMAPGEIADVWIEVKNTGTATWDLPVSGPTQNVVRLGTGSDFDPQNRGRDYSSDFYFAPTACPGYTDPNQCYIPGWWPSPNRAASATPIDIRPGWNARFQFKIKAPDNPGTYREYFTPVADGIGWMKDIGIYWEIGVSRAKSYSFNYDNPNDPKNSEVNKNTSTIVSADQQLLFDALKSNIDYGGFSGVSNFDLNMKLSKAFLAQSDVADWINQNSADLASLKIPLDLAKQSGNEMHLAISSDNTSIRKTSTSREYAKVNLALTSIDAVGGVSDLFNTEVEAIEINGGSDIYTKINSFNLLGNYFNYAKPGTWYGEQQALACSGGDTQCLIDNNLENLDTTTNDVAKFLDSYSKAVARDLNRGGIVIANKGNEVIEGESDTHLQIAITKDNAQRYLDIINESSNASQQMINDNKDIINTYLANSYVDLWINPNTKITKKVLINFNVEKNIVLDKLSITFGYTFKSFNDPSLQVIVPTSFEPMENLDLGTKLEARISPTAVMMMKISSVSRNLWQEAKDSYNSAYKKVKEYFKR